FLVGASRRVVFSSGDLSRAQRTLKSAAESLFCVLFPSDCRICHLPLTNISALPVCNLCLAQIIPLEGDLCSICGEKLFSTQNNAANAAPLCGLCRRAAPPFNKAISYGPYAGALRDLVHLLKYHQVKPAARLLGNLVSGVLAHANLPPDMLVLPVPLWTGKRRTRGFNQAEEIARFVVRDLANGGTASTRIQLDTTSLVRQRETASQTGLTRHQRRANVRGAFAVVRRDVVRGRSILLVDDVMTTGTTAGECARVLLRVGAKEVFVATVARATKEVQSGQAFAAVAQ
ncbi:MAG TPA: ComF family protein, partial [Candidatus Acidoferrales bacterium]|nr:ComF family protein [Candidatus Acidoferrales bacterium]